MLNKAFWLALKTWGSALTLAMGLGACAVMPANGADSWREEVLLHDGQKIIVERSVQRGGRAEVGQQGSYVNQTMRFKMPGNGQSVEWRDELSPDLGNSSFLPMALDVVKGLPYLVVYPMGCLAYNKWGRPNPPYVVFKYDEKTWQRILLDGLPAEIKMPNLIFCSNLMKKAAKFLRVFSTLYCLIYRPPRAIQKNSKNSLRVKKPPTILLEGLKRA